MTRLFPAALAAVALIGCGSEAPPEDSASPREEAVTFSRCMRDNGVREFPDPDASGRLTIDGVLNGSSIDSGSASWKRAVAACKDLQPAGFTGDGKRTPEKQEEALAFAECIRDNGVEDFPDPINGQPLVDTRRIPSSGTDRGMEILNAAMRTCGDRVRGLVQRP